MSAEPAARPAATKAAAAKVPLPTKRLPTDRIKIDKQIDIVRAYVACSGTERKPVRVKQAAEVVDLAEATASLANPFLVENGFITKGDDGFIPSDEVVQFKKAEEVGDDDAPARLAPLLRKSWFFETLRAKLSMGKGVEEKAAVTDLALASNAASDYLPQIRSLIDWLMFARVVQREGTMLSLVRDGGIGASPQSTQEEPRRAPPRLRERWEEPGGDRGGGGGGGSTPINGVGFNVTVSVPMTDLMTWSPERITAFLAGVTEILKAQKGEAS